MVKILSVLGLLALSTSAWAFDDNVDLARDVCNDSTYSWAGDQVKCLEVVDNAWYFDARAVSICAKVTYTNWLAPCFQAAANKTYKYYEIDECSDIHSSDNITACLKFRGQFVAQPEK